MNSSIIAVLLLGTLAVASVGFVVLRLRSNKAKSKATIVDLYESLGKEAMVPRSLRPGERKVGKHPALGKGYGRNYGGTPRLDEADALGVVTHPHLHASLGFGMDEFPLTRHEDRPVQNHVERDGDYGTREHTGFKTGGGFGGDTDFHTGNAFSGSSDSHSSSHDSGSSSSYDSGSSSSDSGGGGGD